MEREELSRLLAAGQSLRATARAMKRTPRTIRPVGFVAVHGRGTFRDWPDRKATMVAGSLSPDYE